MKATEYQVGGNHYRQGNVEGFQHWDFVEAYGYGYLEGYASKYLMRWQLKGTPVQDLEKAHHIIKKLHELYQKGRRQRCLNLPPLETIDLFLKMNNVKDRETCKAFRRLMMWQNELELLAALLTIEGILEREKAKESLNKEIEERRLKRKIGRTEHPSPFGYSPEDDEETED